MIILESFCQNSFCTIYRRILRKRCNSLLMHDRWKMPEILSISPPHTYRYTGTWYLVPRTGTGSIATPSYHDAFFFRAVPRRQEKTYRYPAALPACPTEVGCLGGIMGGFELLPPVHVLRNVFEAPHHPIMSQCPVRHPAPLTWAR